MASDTNVTPTPPNPPRGLPPVEPPTGKFMVQLFTVPLLIVVVAVGFAACFSWLFSQFGTPRSAQDFLKKLDDPNPEVRWRGAEGLAQVLPRDARLASDPDFALQIANRLQQALEANAVAEREPLGAVVTAADRAKLSREDQAKLKKLDDERTYVWYLGACLGHFMVPVGQPLLCRMAEQQSGMNAVGLARRRQQAVLALANLGQNLKRFDDLPEPEQDAIQAKLEAAADKTASTDWAKPALQWVKDRRADRPAAPLVGAVVSTLEKCADPDHSDPFLRELVAFSLNFWQGTAEQNQRIEKVLVALSRDDGRGGDVLEKSYDDGNTETRPVNRTPGLQVRFNATIALANRGSAKTPLNLLGDMLDEDQLREEFKLRRKDNSETVDEAAVNQTLVNALKAVRNLHRQRPKLDLTGLRRAIDKLAEHASATIRKEAKETQDAL
jgi:hypothetical protein